MHERLGGAGEGVDRGLDDRVVERGVVGVAAGRDVDRTVMAAQLRGEPLRVEQVADDAGRTSILDLERGLLATDDCGDLVARVDQVAEHG